MDSGVTLVKKDITEDLGLAYRVGSVCVTVTLVNVIEDQGDALTVLIIPQENIVRSVSVDMLGML